MLWLLFKTRLNQSAGEKYCSSSSNLNLKEVARVMMHLFDYSIYYLSSQAVRKKVICVPVGACGPAVCDSLRWQWSVSAHYRQLRGQCINATAQRIRMQSNPQQWKGPNQQHPVDGMSATKQRNTRPEATNKTIHSSCFPYKQRKITPLIFVTQLGVRRREWNWRQSNDSWLSIRHSKSSSVGGPVGIQHWVKSRSRGFYTIFPPVTFAECHI